MLGMNVLIPSETGKVLNDLLGHAGYNVIVLIPSETGKVLNRSTLIPLYFQ